MILGLEARAHVCGWALLDTAARSFVDLGVIVAVGADVAGMAGARDGHAAAEKLRGELGAVAIEAVAVSHAPTLGFAWGVVVGLALYYRPEVAEVPPARWHRVVLPNVRSHPEPEAARVVGLHLLSKHAAAVTAMRRVPAEHQDLALVAAMMALAVAVRPR